MEINVKDYQSKREIKRDYRKTFWKDRYNDRASDEEKENLNNILGYNQALWKLAHQRGFNWETIKVESVDSKFENERPGYVGRMSGDLLVNYKGSVVIGNDTYFNIWSSRIDTNGFW